MMFDPKGKLSLTTSIHTNSVINIYIWLMTLFSYKLSDFSLFAVDSFLFRRVFFSVPPPLLRSSYFIAKVIIALFILLLINAIKATQQATNTSSCMSSCVLCFHITLSNYYLLMNLFFELQHIKGAHQAWNRLQMLCVYKKDFIYSSVFHPIKVYLLSLPFHLRLYITQFFLIFL